MEAYKLNKEELDNSKILLNKKLKSLHLTKHTKLIQNIQRIENVRNKKNIVDEVTIVPYATYDIPISYKKLAYNYIDLFLKLSKLYQLKVKCQIDLPESFEHINLYHVKWVRKNYKFIDVFPPVLKKRCRDIISTDINIVQCSDEELSCNTITGYIRESNLIEDFLLCSSTTAFNSCASFKNRGQGQNTPFIYMQSQYDKIAFLYDTKESAILGNGNFKYRVVISFFPEAIVPHRAYGDANTADFKYNYLQFYLQNYDNYKIDNTSVIKIEQPGGLKDAYPDIAISGVTMSLIANTNSSNIKSLFNSEYKKIDKTLLLF